jgi:hypothetical protein
MFEVRRAISAIWAETDIWRLSSANFIEFVQRTNTWDYVGSRAAAAAPTRTRNDRLAQRRKQASRSLAPSPAAAAAACYGF